MSKLQQNTTIFSVMTQMAHQYNAINLAQGFPDFPVDPILKNSVSTLAQHEIHQYMPMSGHPALLEKIARLTEDSYARKVSASSEILITAGATEAIFAAIQTLVQKNEEVVILDPAYDCYDAPIVLRYAKPIHVNLKADFTPDWETIGAAMNSHTRMIIINNPHNPSGRIWTDNDYLQLEKLLDLYPDVIVLADFQK